MLLRPLFRVFAAGQLLPALAANALYKSFYKVSYLAALENAGLMSRLRRAPVTFQSLAAEAPDPKAVEALLAWLQMGCKLGLLHLGDEGYTLRGLARKLAQSQNDATLALTQEVASLHHRLITESVPRLREGRTWGLDNQDPVLTARSSRALEAFQREALERWIPKDGTCRLLEIGCGSAVYIRYAAMLNPQLTALGLELQDEAACRAQDNIRAWGLHDRVRIETGDIRTVQGEAVYDVATLYNNIYYFPVAERVAILACIGRHLRPGGSLLLVTCCQGGSAGIQALNLWGATNRHGGRLPDVAEMQSQLARAGFENVDTMRLIPGDAFVAFHAHTQPSDTRQRSDRRARPNRRPATSRSLLRQSRTRSRPRR